MRSVIRVVASLLLCAGGLAHSAETTSPPRWLRIGIVQMSLGRTLAENRDRIVAGITNTAARRARVAVFPEGALRGVGGDQPALVEQAVSAIQLAAREAKLFAVLGGSTYSTQLNKDANWMRVIDPDGREVFHYEKLYDHPQATMPSRCGRQSSRWQSAPPRAACGPGHESVDGHHHADARSLCARRRQESARPVVSTVPQQISSPRVSNGSCQVHRPSLGWLRRRSASPKRRRSSRARLS